MYSPKQRIIDGIGSTHADAFKSLLEHPAYRSLMSNCYQQIGCLSPGEVTSETASHALFFETGLKSVFDIVEAVAFSDSSLLPELEEEPTPEEDAKLD